MEYEIDDEESVNTAVVYAVSAVVGRDPSSLPPLAHVVDPDALEMLFSPRDGEPRPGGYVSFIYANCRVTVDNGEFLTVEPLKKQYAADGDPRRPDAE